MTDAVTTEKPEPAVLARAHRSLRVLSDADGPFAGTLATSGDSVVVRCPSEALAGWSGWRLAGAQHVAGPLDVVRRVDGHDVLLPWCTDRLQTFVDRRRGDGRPLSAGEVCTVVVSLLRGMGELAARGGATSGIWWLTDDGRPMFVVGEGESCGSAAAGIVEALGEAETDRTVKRLLDRVGHGLRERLHAPGLPSRLLEEWERELLTIAAPRALERVDPEPAPVLARDLARAVVANASDVRPTRRSLAIQKSRRREAESVPARLGAMVLHIRDSIGSRISRVRAAVGVRGPGTRDRSPRMGGQRASRRRVALIAGAGAAVVLVGGLMWPGEDGGGARGATSDRHAQPAEEGPVVEQRPTFDPGSSRRPGASTAAMSGDPVAAVPSLLAAIETCRDDANAECPSAIAPGSVGVAEKLSALEGAEHSVELVDEYGDVAVTSVTPSGASTPEDPNVMVVVERRDEKWLVRDVYDVADQPE
ncbi:hypothetical protein [Microbacterium paraoxydans]|uniref:hypothetical protein n=1 Tax=Microbacterium paraoxydans TaxID=199592 RepID=UPI003D73F6DC